MRRLVLILLSHCFFSQAFTLTDLHVNEGSLFCEHPQSTDSPPYVRNPYVSDEVWNMMQPYFLPETMPEKAILDTIFSEQRVLASASALSKAGFIPLTPSNHKTVVAKHPALKGFLIKAHFDWVETSDWVWWKKRIDGVNAIQRSIEHHGYQLLMKTPKKWVYPLPVTSFLPADRSRSNFILVVEQMDILNPESNLLAYHQEMTRELLDALYTVILENYLLDSIYYDNTPFCEDGRLAFIDTEQSKSSEKMEIGPLNTPLFKSIKTIEDANIARIKAAKQELEKQLK